MEKSLGGEGRGGKGREIKLQGQQVPSAVLYLEGFAILLFREDFCQVKCMCVWVINTYFPRSASNHALHFQHYILNPVMDQHL